MLLLWEGTQVRVQAVLQSYLQAKLLSSPQRVALKEGTFASLVGDCAVIGFI